MNKEHHLPELLRWRLARAEAEAPRAPRAARLLELARPWWETYPERFQLMLERLREIPVNYALAMAEPGASCGVGLVPVLIACGPNEVESLAHLLYFNVRDGRLRLRIALDSSTGPSLETWDVTFVSEKGATPLFSTTAIRSVDYEYRIEAEISQALVACWDELKVTDRMPFRLILRSDQSAD